VHLFSAWVAKFYFIFRIAYAAFGFEERLTF